MAGERVANDIAALNASCDEEQDGLAQSSGMRVKGFGE